MSERQQLSLSFIDQERTAKGLTPLLQRLPLGHLVLVSQQDTEASAASKAALLEPREDYKEGRDDSLQKVHFADLSVVGEKSTLSTQPVAIKPFGVEWLATRDYRTAVNLNSERHNQI